MRTYYVGFFGGKRGTEFPTLILAKKYASALRRSGLADVMGIASYDVRYPMCKTWKQYKY